MHPLHIVVSVVNLTCGLAVLLAYYTSLKSIMGLGVFFGYFANLTAILITLILAALEIYSVIKEKAHIFKRNWLGFLNGGFVVVFWLAVVFINEKI